MNNRYVELSFDQLHSDLTDLRDVLTNLPQVIADNLPEAVNRKHMNVTVNNPIDEVHGTVQVTNKLSLAELPEITAKLDLVIKAVETSKTEDVFVKNPIVIENLPEIAQLLKQLNAKNTEVKVAAPIVNVPDEVKIDNWPRDPKDPISVRLSDGQQFINQLQRIIGGGGGIQSSLTIGDAVKVVNPDGSPIGAGGSAGTYTLANANNSYGQTLSLANATTGTIVNIASSTSGYKIAGMNTTGNGDGYFFVTVGGSTVLSGRTTFSNPTCSIILPNPLAVTLGSTVSLKVTNLSGSTADFEGTLLGA